VLGELLARLQQLEQRSAPKLVAEVQFGEWSEAGALRHPSFIGLREDKKPLEVVREKASFIHGVLKCRSPKGPTG
jgi:ATP-dependent DNA ligase